MKKNVVVIGSGLAGTLICNRLIENCDVTLLERGEKDAITYPKIDFVGKQFGQVKTFCLGGGGTTNLWHNGLMPINKEDVLSKEFHDVLVEAEPYMDQAASNLYFKNSSYLSEYNNVLSEMELIADKLGIFKDGIDCIFYPKRYKKLFVDDRVKAFYSVNDIGFIPKERRIQSVRYYVGAREYFANPDIMVICAGALSTPLLVEKLLSATNLSFEQLGTGLADHPIGFVGKIKVKKDVAKLVRKFSLHDKGSYKCRTAFRVRSECGKYTCCAYFRPAMTMQNKLSIYKYKSRLGASSGKDRIRNTFSVKIFHPDILAEIFSYLFGADIPTRIYNILLLLEQKRGKSRVSYNGGRLKVDWGISEEELAIYNGILKKINDMLSHVADKLNVKMDISEEWLWSAAHHSGTIGLGSGTDDLIDKDLKLKFCDNVYVCDGSVIQEHSYANTGLTIGQLAMRLAERVENEGMAS